MRDDEMDGLADDGDDDADEPGFTMVPADDGADDETVDAIVREAATLGTEDRWEEAHEMLLNAVEEQGENATLLCYLGLAAQRLGSDSEAYEVFRRCLALQPTDPFILASAGTGLAAFDDPDAEGTLRLAALTAPDMPYARAAYGSYLAREGMLPEATAELETARTLAPDDAGVRAELAAAYLLAKRKDEGLAEIEEALSQEADDSWLRALYGLALLDAGRNEEAAEELHRASGERPEDVELALAAALSASSQGWQDEAYAALARAEAAAEALDRDAIEEVEEAVEEGAEAAEDFLREQLGPSLLRERLLQRP